MAKSFGVAFNTLRQALDVLEKDRYVVRKLGSGTYATLPAQTKRKVLVVDDEEIVRQLFVRSMGNGEWDVDMACNGIEAMKCLEKRTYDLIFLDLVMPDMNGPETFAAMRAKKWDCPVVIITDYPDSSLLAQALQTGPVAMLRKPFTQREINEALRRYAQHATEEQSTTFSNIGRSNEKR